MSDPPEGPVLELPPTGTGERVRRRLERERREHRRHETARWAFAVGFVALLSAIPVLGYVGFDAVLRSTQGRALDPVNDPARPGYEANVTATPVELLVQVDDKGALASVTILALGAGDAGGSVLLLPPDTTTAEGTGTLRDAYAAGGAATIGDATSRLLRLGFDQVDVVDDARWAALVGPAAPLSILNPDRVPRPGGTSKQIFAAGPLDLAAGDVGPYLRAATTTENDLNRLGRQQLVWRAWLQRIASDPAAAPGEADAGVGRYVRTLAAGAVLIDPLPVTAGRGTFSIDATAMPAALAAAIPFPASAANVARVRVRVLDGVGRPGLALAAAARLVPAGAEIAIVGNADRFGYEATVVRYSGDEDRGNATAMATALGVGELEQSTVIDDVVQVTVIVGNDYVARYGAPAAGATTTTEGTAGG